jgi:uncharacterized protein (DUF697 family)
MIDPNNIYKAYKFARKMSNNQDPKDTSKRAERTIRNHVMWSMGAGFIPFPVADFLAVAAVQLDMVRSLSNVYGVDFKETEGKALITSLTGSGLSRVGANALIKLIPGVGTALGGVSMSIMSGASTYALGQVFKRHFEGGGSFLDFDTDRFRRFYDEQFEKGKKVAEDINKEEKKKKEAPKEEEVELKDDTPEEVEVVVDVKEEPKNEAKASNTEKTKANDEIVNKLKELAELKEMGVITEEEFNEMKKRLIENFYK